VGSPGADLRLNRVVHPSNMRDSVGMGTG
jgi:hypothetical protein